MNKTHQPRILSDKKISMVRSLRNLTHVLGKLNVRCMVFDYSEYGRSNNFPAHWVAPPTIYGWGLRDSLTFVERVYPNLE